MGCASSTASKADKQPPHTLTWPNLTVRVGWTEFDIKKCALLMTVTDEEGKVLMTLRGNTADRGSVCEFFVDGERTYHSDWRTTGTEQDPVKERFIVQDEDSTGAPGPSRGVILFARRHTVCCLATARALPWPAPASSRPAPPPSHLSQP